MASVRRWRRAPDPLHARHLSRRARAGGRLRRAASLPAALGFGGRCRELVYGVAHGGLARRDARARGAIRELTLRAWLAGRARRSYTPVTDSQLPAEYIQTKATSR